MSVAHFQLTAAFFQRPIDQGNLPVPLGPVPAHGPEIGP